MLKDNFFAIRERTADESSSKFIVVLDENHRVYDGHFPGMPVVPGVCTLQMVKECAEEVAGKKLRYANIANCKFLAMIVPTMVKELEINVTLQPSDGGFSLKATVKSPEASYLTLKAELVALA